MKKVKKLILFVTVLVMLPMSVYAQTSYTITHSDGSVSSFSTETLAGTINGDVELIDGTLRLQGKTLKIQGNLIQSGGSLEIDGGELNVSGDYRIQYPPSGSDTEYSLSLGSLIMVNPDDRVTVGGDFVMDSYQSSQGGLTNGEMTLMGNFTQYSSTSDPSNFQASEEHKVILAGDGEQVIHFDSPSTSSSSKSQFSKLHISNTSGSVDFSTQVSIKELTYSGDILTVNSLNLINSPLSLTNDIVVLEDTELVDTYLSLNGHTLSINGDLSLEGAYQQLDINGGKLLISENLIQPNGNLDINGGELNVSGDYRIQYPPSGSDTEYSLSLGSLIMVNPDDRVTVGGDFVMDSYQSSQGGLTNGEMTLMGNFTQYSSTSDPSNFQASEEHKVILAGDGEQVIHFDESQYSYFGKLIITNRSSLGVNFSTEVKVTTLFEHNQKPFTLYSDLKANFPDYDEDGVKDHLDAYPQNASLSSPDSDGDGIQDTDDNCKLVFNKNQADLDNDGIGNVCDTDKDGDSFDNEVDAFSNNPSEWLDSDADRVGNNSDTDDDNDGMSDAWELTNGLDSLNASDAAMDTDGDNVSNLDEYRASTDPQLADTDGDGINDDLDQVVGSGLWGYACNVVNDPNSTTRRWGINQYNLADQPNAPAEAVYSMGQNRKIQSVACDPSGENILFSMKDSLRGDYEIFELDTLSGGITQITDNDTDDVDVTRSRDRRTIAWQMRLPDNRQAIELRRLQENGEYTVKTMASASPFVQPALSANGLWMSFVQLRPNYFAVMRYDITNNKYKEVKSIARRKKLYHPSITDDGNQVGWSERVSQRRYRVKNMAEGTTVDILNDASGIEHAVLSGDGEHVIYTVNASNIRETYLTVLSTLDTQVIGETHNDPVRYLSANWLGAPASEGFDDSQISGRLLTSYSQSLAFSFQPDGSGSRYTLGDDDAIDFIWQITNGALVITDNVSQQVWTMRLLAMTNDGQFTVSAVSPDENGGVKRTIDTIYIE